MKRAQKEKLAAKYMPGVPEITDYQREWIKKETAHFIFVEKGDDGKHKCTCDRCGEKYEVAKTKHRAKMICPSCKKEMEIMHLWRNDSERTVDWIAIPRVVDKETLMLRYVFAIRRGASGAGVEEAARIVMNTNLKTMHYFENECGNWIYSKVHYFAEFNMYYYRKQWCCLQAKPYRPTFKREINRLECFRYFRDYMKYVGEYYYINDGVHNIMQRAELYEKLQKAGFEKLMEDDWASRGKIPFNHKEKSLAKMLGINKAQLRLLKENQSVKTWQTIHDCSDENIEILALLIKTNTNKYQVQKIKDLKVSLIHTLRYLDKEKCNTEEWLHYVSLLGKLNYKLDSSYLYPRDFRKMDETVSDEYEDVLYGKADSERDVAIRRISRALQSNKEIMEFFKGSNGLQIVVPETSKDFRRESKNLHNCIKGYPDKVARGDTLLFFIRRIEDPTASFVAMEYKHGRIVQCMYDYNKRVDDKNILDFANALAQKLKKQNILAA